MSTLRHLENWELEQWWLQPKGQRSLRDDVRDRRFMSQATRYCARSATGARSVRRVEEKNFIFIFLFPSSRASRSCRAPREISCSPRLAHRAPIMQAIFKYDEHFTLGRDLYAGYVVIPEKRKNKWQCKQKIITSRCKILIVPEVGWFGQSKYRTHKIHSTLCQLLLLLSSETQMW